MLGHLGKNASMILTNQKPLTQKPTNSQTEKKIVKVRDGLCSASKKYNHLKAEANSCRWHFKKPLPSISTWPVHMNTRKLLA